MLVLLCSWDYDEKTEDGAGKQYYEMCRESSSFKVNNHLSITFNYYKISVYWRQLGNTNKNKKMEMWLIVDALYYIFNTELLTFYWTMYWIWSLLTSLAIFSLSLPISLHSNSL